MNVRIALAFLALLLSTMIALMILHMRMQHQAGLIQEHQKKLSLRKSDRKEKHPHEEPPSTNLDKPIIELPGVPLWRQKLNQLHPLILKRLNEHPPTPLHQLLTGGYRPQPMRVSLERDGKCIGFDTREPINAAEHVYQVDKTHERESAAELLSRVIIDGVLSSRKEVYGPAKTLIDIIKTPELGEGIDGLVVEALRRTAATYLRGQNLDEADRAALEGLANSHLDPVLRGAIVGSLIAYKDQDQFVANWIRNENAPQALHAALAELTRTDSRSLYLTPELSRTVDGETTGTGGICTYPIPQSGAALVKELLLLLNSNSTAHLQAEGEFWRVSKQHPGRYSGLKQYFEDLPSLAIACLYTRVTPECVPSIEARLEAEGNARLRLGLISVLGRGEGPPYTDALSRLIATQEISVKEKIVAIRSTIPSRSQHTTSFLESVLWDPNVSLRDMACFILDARACPVSNRAILRMQQLGNESTDAAARQQYFDAVEKFKRRAEPRQN